jgi:hypothetical protein
LCAALTGYLALLQLGAAQTLARLGLNQGDLQTYAAWNGISAFVTVVFGVRLLQRPTRGTLNWSIGWAILSVIGGAIQVSSGASNDIFLGSIVAAGVAGALSYAARGLAPETKSVEPALAVPPAAPPTPVSPPLIPAASPSPPLAAPSPSVVDLEERDPASSDPQPTQGRSRPARLAILGGIALGIIALSLAGIELSGATNPQPTPSPTATATPTASPTATLAALPPGKVTFGKAAYKVGAPIDYTATVNQDPGERPLLLRLLSGGQTVGSNAIDPGSVHAGQIVGTLTVSGAGPGSYTVRFEAGGVVLAEGTIRLTK